MSPLVVGGTRLCDNQERVALPLEWSDKSGPDVGELLCKQLNSEFPEVAWVCGGSSGKKGKDEENGDAKRKKNAPDSQQKRRRYKRKPRHSNFKDGYRLRCEHYGKEPEKSKKKSKSGKTRKGFTKKRGCLASLNLFFKPDDPSSNGKGRWFIGTRNLTHQNHPAPSSNLITKLDGKLREKAAELLSIDGRPAQISDHMSGISNAIVPKRALVDVRREVRMKEEAEEFERAIKEIQKRNPKLSDADAKNLLFGPFTDKSPGSRFLVTLKVMTLLYGVKWYGSLGPPSASALSQHKVWREFWKQNFQSPSQPLLEMTEDRLEVVMELLLKLLPPVTVSSDVFLESLSGDPVTINTATAENHSDSHQSGDPSVQEFIHSFLDDDGNSGGAIDAGSTTFDMDTEKSAESESNATSQSNEVFVLSQSLPMLGAGNGQSQNFQSSQQILLPSASSQTAASGVSFSVCSL